MKWDKFMERSRSVKIYYRRAHRQANYVGGCIKSEGYNTQLMWDSTFANRLHTFAYRAQKLFAAGYPVGEPPELVSIAHHGDPKTWEEWNDLLQQLESKMDRPFVYSPGWNTPDAVKALQAMPRAKPYEPKPKDPNTFTYFIHAVGTNRLKIGKASVPQQRLRELQTGCPFPLKIVAVLQGDREEEFHLEFRQNRIQGEWFTFTDKMLNQLVEMGVRISDLRELAHAR